MESLAAPRVVGLQGDLVVKGVAPTGAVGGMIGPDGLGKEPFNGEPPMSLELGSDLAVALIPLFAGGFGECGNVDPFAMDGKVAEAEIAVARIRTLASFDVRKDAASSMGNCSRSSASVVAAA